MYTHPNTITAIIPFICFSSRTGFPLSNPLLLAHRDISRRNRFWKRQSEQRRAERQRMRKRIRNRHGYRRPRHTRYARRAHRDFQLRTRILTDLGWGDLMHIIGYCGWVIRGIDRRIARSLICHLSERIRSLAENRTLDTDDYHHQEGADHKRHFNERLAASEPATRLFASAPESGHRIVSLSTEHCFLLLHVHLKLHLSVMYE